VLPVDGMVKCNGPL